MITPPSVICLKNGGIDADESVMMAMTPLHALYEYFLHSTLTLIILPYISQMAGLLQYQPTFKARCFTCLTSIT